MKNKKIILSILFIWFVIWFNVYDSYSSGIYIFEQYIIFYIDSFNGYLFSTTILIYPILIFTQIDYKISEINIRILKNKFEYIWINNIKYILIIMSNIILGSILVSAAYQFDFLKQLNLYYCFRLFIFLLFCFVIREVFYLIFQKRIVGTFALVLHNFIFLATMYSWNYYILNNAWNMEDLLQIFVIYETIISIASLVYLYFKMEKKEFLK